MSQPYRPEPPQAFFQAYADAATRGSAAEGYGRMAQTFNEFLRQHTEAAGIHFAGTFAKTDHLLKAHDAPEALRAAVHQARIRLRRRALIDEATLAEGRRADAAALCHLAALTCGVAVPESIARLLPPPAAAPRRTAVKMAACVRAVVVRRDDALVFLRADGDEGRTLCLDLARPARGAGGPNRLYLAPMLAEGRQVNLIAPVLLADGEHVEAELVVLEPDYLMDVSAVAACAEDYGDTPLTALVRRLTPHDDTDATLLGTLAGQLLDDEMRHAPDGARYEDSVSRFFRYKPLALLTTPLEADFHQRARQQQQHIRRALTQTLPQAVPGFDLRHAMVEPSFFSEALGLQGRMDFLQWDGRVIMEQKSGKCGYPQQRPDVPVLARKHYVQVLLYVAMLRHLHGAQPDLTHNMQAFLLYSRYAESLEAVGYAPTVVFEAMRLRNRIVGMEHHLASAGYGLLTTLTADRLNENACQSRLWREWQRPAIEQTLTPLRQASPLERAYCLRLLAFLSREHLLAKTGNARKENSGFAATWHDAPDDKRAAGNIYDGLHMVEPAGNEGESDDATDGAPRTVTHVVLAFGERPDDGMSNFRTGDIVLLYPYRPGEEPDVRRTMVFRATLTDVRDGHIRLTLRAEQTDARVFTMHHGALWAIEHDFMEASFAPLYLSTRHFLTAPQERRDLLMMQRRPRTDASLTLRGCYGDFDTLTLRARQARDLFLIVGPPGTGKTSFGLVNTLREELHDAEASVLLMAYTNRAVDEICSKLAEADLPFIRLGGAAVCPAPYRRHLLGEQATAAASLTAMKAVLQRTPIIVGTTTAVTASAALFAVKHFTLAIIDEASQILEPHILTPLSATHQGRPAIDRFVLIGDHKQLPAVVQQTARESAVEDEALRAIGLTDCRLSLFERLLHRYGDDPAVCYTLTRQGRMHRDIALFPNMAFYGGRLHTVPLPHQERPLPPIDATAMAPAEVLLLSHRVLFMDVPLPPVAVSDKVNTTEAAIIAAIVARMQRRMGAAFVPQQSVGIIVPYRHQIAAIRRAMEREGVTGAADITIDTVERYQGSQRDTIIYGFTVQRHAQLDFLTEHTFTEDGMTIDRKLNVAMTRAREHLYLVGHAPLLAHIATFAALIDFCRARHAFCRVTPAGFAACR
ncbi:MAG: ATP-binding protein [Bacteroidales bacterium]|nr:ATP-binding protein [Bacteroidales bacterium]